MAVTIDLSPTTPKKQDNTAPPFIPSMPPETAQGSHLRIQPEPSLSRRSWEEMAGSAFTSDSDRANRRRTWNGFEALEGDFRLSVIVYHQGLTNNAAVQFSTADETLVPTAQNANDLSIGMYCRVKSKLFNGAQTPKEDANGLKRVKETESGRGKAWKKLEKDNTIRSRNRKLTVESRLNEWRIRAVNFALPSLPGTPRRQSVADTQPRALRRNVPKQLPVPTPVPQNIKTPYPTPSPVGNEEKSLEGGFVFTKEYFLSRFSITPSTDKGSSMKQDEHKSSDQVSTMRGRKKTWKRRWSALQKKIRLEPKKAHIGVVSDTKSTPLQLSLIPSFTASNLTIAFDSQMSNGVPGTKSESLANKSPFRFSVPPFSRFSSPAPSNR